MQDDSSGTKPVAENMKVDLGALADYMRKHVEGFSGDAEIQIEQFKGG